MGVAKDLEDLSRLMEQYELDGERRFSDEVFEAGADYESAGAFLLGMDVGWLCTGSEAKIVGNLIEVLEVSRMTTSPPGGCWREGGSRSMRSRKGRSGLKLSPGDLSSDNGEATIGETLV